MNAILYLRFSTDEQADGDSERRQTERAKRWCHDNRHVLTKIYADKGISGGKGSRDRKGLASLLDDLDRGVAPAFLLTEDVDRLSRQLPLEASKLIERILSHDVTIV
jgi:DNA invertase Pin-like site-specific DNA recombinase